MKSKFVWDLKRRQMLENLLHEGLSVSRIGNAMDLPKPAIYAEIRKGVSMEEYAQGRYIKYTAERSIENQLEELKLYLFEGEQGHVWDFRRRQMLENLLHEGLSVPKIANAMDLPRGTIYTEIRKGVSMEEYAQGRYVKYTAERSIENQLEELRRYLVEGEQD